MEKTLKITDSSYNFLYLIYSISQKGVHPHISATFLE